MKGIRKTNSVHKYSLGELECIARRMAREVAAPFSVLLEGDVGAGKTTFSQFFINELQEVSQQLVTSPTFNIVQVYDTTKGQVWHVDLYRIKHEEEIFELGLLEAMHEHVCLIEWPYILQSGCLKHYIENCDIKIINL